MLALCILAASCHATREREGSGIPVCGNGVLEGEEECEVGSFVDCTTVCGSTGRGACTDDCTVPAPEACTPPQEACGNGVDDDCDGSPEVLDDLENPTGLLDRVWSEHGWWMTAIAPVPDSSGSFVVAASRDNGYGDMSMHLWRIGPDGRVQSGTSSSIFGERWIIMHVLPGLSVRRDGSVVLAFVGKNEGWWDDLYVTILDGDLSPLTDPVWIPSLEWLEPAKPAVVTTEDAIFVLLREYGSRPDAFVAIELDPGTLEVVDERAFTDVPLPRGTIEAVLHGDRIHMCWFSPCTGADDSVYIAGLDTDLSTLEIRRVSSEGVDATAWECAIAAGGERLTMVWEEEGVAKLAAISPDEGYDIFWKRDLPLPSPAPSLQMHGYRIAWTGTRYHVLLGARTHPDEPLFLLAHDSTFEDVDAGIVTHVAPVPERVWRLESAIWNEGRFDLMLLQDNEYPTDSILMSAILSCS